MVSNQETMSVQRLQVFTAIAKRGGVTAAAEALDMAKSAVSKHLAALESQLQVRLFERTGRRIALTAEGRLLLPRAESILAELDHFVSDAQHQVAQARGTVRISASPEFGAFLSERFLPVLRRQHEALDVAMTLEYRFDDLHDPGVDLAFRLGSIHDDRLVARPLGEFPRVLVCSPAYARARPIATPADLERADALLFSDRELTEEWSLQSLRGPVQRHEVRVRGHIAVRGFEALAGAAVAGLGIARLPRFVAARGLADGSLVQVLPRLQPPPVPVFLAYRPGVARVARVRAVIDLAQLELPALLAGETGNGARRRP